MTDASDEIPEAVVEAFWRDLMTWLREVATVHLSDDSRTTFTFHGSKHRDVLAFGPAEWALFVLRGDWLADEHPAVYVPAISGSAWDLLSETLGSKGSPLVVRDGRLVRE